MLDNPAARDERALITTAAPARASASAVARPMRRTPPVTIAAWPASGLSSANGLLLFSRRWAAAYAIVSGARAKAQWRIASIS